MKLTTEQKAQLKWHSGDSEKISALVEEWLDEAVKSGALLGAIFCEQRPPEGWEDRSRWGVKTNGGVVHDVIDEESADAIVEKLSSMRGMEVEVVRQKVWTSPWEEVE